MWVTAGTENGHTLQYRITDCCIEKRVLHNGVVVRETVEELQNPRSRDALRSYVNDIPRSYASRPPRHSSVRRSPQRHILGGRRHKRRMAGGRVAGGRIVGGRVTGGRVSGGRIVGGRIAGGRVAGGARGSRGSCW